MIVVIGGGGYIGSVTVERLVDDGYDVLVWDDFSLGHTVREVIDVAGEVTGRLFEVREGNRRPDDPPRLVADYEKALELLNWEPERDLEETVTDAWQWMCENNSKSDLEP